MKFSTFFDYQFWKIAVGVWNINKMSLIAGIGNSVKKNAIIYFQWFSSYTFFNEALQPPLLAKKMTDKC
jgi:hypothetical protein